MRPELYSSEFKMLNITLMSQVQFEDWFETIDLKEAYFHIKILPENRKLLRFAFMG